MKHLTMQQLHILDLLSRREHVTRDQIIDHVYSAIPECDWPDNQEKVVHVRICELRKWLACLNIEISRLAGGGHIQATYSIPAKDRKFVRYIVENYFSILSGDMELPNVA